MGRVDTTLVLLVIGVLLLLIGLVMIILRFTGSGPVDMKAGPVQISTQSAGIAVMLVGVVVIGLLVNSIGGPHPASATSTAAGTAGATKTAPPAAASPAYLLKLVPTNGDTPLGGVVTMRGASYQNSIWYDDVQRYPQGFSGDPSTWVTTYALDGQYTKFTATIGDSEVNCSQPNMEFDVLLDGTRIYQQVITACETVPVSLDISGGKQLTLQSATNRGSGWGLPTWGNAMVSP
jgi:hypothetical protein